MGRRVTTIEQDLSAIAAAHRLADLPSPREAAVVRAVRRGIRRELGVAQGQKAPLLAETLKAVVRELPETLAGARDRALLLVGFAGAFRRSELVGIAVEDLEWVEEGLKVRLRRSKTDQEGEGVTVGIPKGSRPATCPAAALKARLEASGITGGPVFREVTRHGAVGERTLSGGSVARVVKRAAVLAGLEPAAFAGHSLRAGLASSAARARKTERDIMRQTRHTSPAMVRRYIREAGVFEDNAAEGLLQLRADIQGRSRRLWFAVSEPIDEVGPWTEVKVQIVREYALYFQKIIQAKGSYNFTSVYMDGFAGTGILLSETQGDMIGGTAPEIMDVQPAFNEYHFIEINPEKVQILRRVLGVMDDADDLVRVHRGDCNTILLDKLLPKMRYDSYRKGLLFLDPYGLHVDWKVVEAAGHSRCVDLLINFPIMHMNRSILRDPSKAPPSPAEVQRMNRFWGDESWRDAAYEAPIDLFGSRLPLRKKEGNEPIVEAYIKRLRELAGFQHVSKRLPMRNRTNSPVYYLIGASAAPQGVKLFNGVFKKWSRRGLPIVPAEHDRVD